MSSKNNRGGGGGGGWSNKPASVLQAAAAAASNQSSSGNNHNNNNNRRGGGDGRKGPPNRSASESSRKGGGRGGRGGVHRSKSGRGGNNNNNGGVPQRSNSRIATRLEDIELHAPGTGRNPAEQQVIRHNLQAFFSIRMQCTEPPPKSDNSNNTNTNNDTELDEETQFNPHERCAWTDARRIELIENEMKVLWDFKPLNINDDTRWKAKVMLDDDGNAIIDKDSPEEILRKAIAILNKLSWTTLEKLTVKFVDTLQGGGGGGNNGDGAAEASLSKEMVHDSLKLVVDKAMAEPHFAELYARFSGKLAAVHKVFKKILLKICQEEFERTDQEADVSHITDPAEREYVLRISRKASLGLMSFIGELYKLKLIKGAIMIGCLQRLLVVKDEERLECFANLMTTVGERLHEIEDEPEVHDIWADVASMAGRAETPGGPQAPNVRIKFLLQDLLELKENGWVARREEEKAKTIAQIHKEAAEEERASRRNNNNNNNRHHNNNKPGMTRAKSVSSVTMSSSLPMIKSKAPQGGNLTRHQSVDDDGFTQVAKPKKSAPRRSASDSVKSINSKMSSLQVADKRVKQKPPAPKAYLAPKEVADKTKSVLKEYFVGGDTADAVLSLQELIGVGTNFDVDRGTAAIQAGVLLVLEQKEEQVKLFLTVIQRCVEESKIPLPSLAKGLMDPLEFLRDIEIDAPLASKHLALIMGDWIRNAWITLKVLQSAPEYFLSDGRPAELAKDVLRQRGDEVSETEVGIVQALLSPDELEKIESVADWIKA